ncbi:hypothetical protein [Cellulomonas sp. PS-H5]|uniref:hypothetical protein n=1 Tax=Cellulomonas sp. PS-H5 TaxID=2820400 RepID=UPI001C4E606A|nr:hypothetical protein [Cellulomonas sp. PS-H5]MBW0254483.1 hypothetical protein [Cellulomonas sp. PS-H5]
MELDDAGSVDIAEDRNSAQAQAHQHGGDVVRIETWPVDARAVSLDRDAWIAHIRHVLDRADERDEQVLDAVLDTLRSVEHAGTLSVVDVMTSYDQVQDAYAEALDGWARADQRAADALRALKGAVRDVEAAAAARHLDGGLDAALSALRAAAGAASAPAADPAPWLPTPGHLFNGRCPEPDRPGARDPECPACRALDAR